MLNASELTRTATEVPKLSSRGVDAERRNVKILDGKRFSFCAPRKPRKKTTKKSSNRIFYHIVKDIRTDYSKFNQSTHTNAKHTLYSPSLYLFMQVRSFYVSCHRIITDKTFFRLCAKRDRIVNEPVLGYI